MQIEVLTVQLMLRGLIRLLRNTEKHDENPTVRTLNRAVRRVSVYPQCEYLMLCFYVTTRPGVRPPGRRRAVVLCQLPLPWMPHFDLFFYCGPAAWPLWFQVRGHGAAEIKARAAKQKADKCSSTCNLNVNLPPGRR